MAQGTQLWGYRATVRAIPGGSCGGSSTPGCVEQQTVDEEETLWVTDTWKEQGVPCPLSGHRCPRRPAGPSTQWLEATDNLLIDK